jgi:ABC-type spermidine/putrescine transport system permease subunit I
MSKYADHANPMLNAASSPRTDMELPSASIAAARSVDRLAFLRRISFERGAFVAFAFVWAAFVVVPLLGVVLFSFVGGWGLSMTGSISLDAYRDIAESGGWDVLARTSAMACYVSVVCMAIGFPFALWLARQAKSQFLKQLIWIALTVPFFLDPSARTLVWRTILGRDGMVNNALLYIGVIHAPLQWLLFSDISVFFGLVISYFPNAVWPAYLAITLIPEELLQAGRDLGASPAAMLRDITLPLCAPGLVAGFMFTFIPVLGDTVASTLLGGGMHDYLGTSISGLVDALDYAGAAAFATIVLALSAALLGLFWLVRRVVGRTELSA